MMHMVAVQVTGAASTAHTIVIGRHRLLLQRVRMAAVEIEIETGGQAAITQQAAGAVDPNGSPHRSASA